MRFNTTTLFLLAVPVLSYSNAASTSLQQLTAELQTTNTFVNALRGCGYRSTTDAISRGVATKDGSACPSADQQISQRLISLARHEQSTLALLRSSESTGDVTSSHIVAKFNDYASAYYTLFNAMDLAECTYILTPQSQAFAAQFTQTNSLKDGFNDIVAQLSKDIATGIQIVGTNLKQQTHFAGTSFLATQVGGPKLLAGAACKIITAVVESEGGGTR